VWRAAYRRVVRTTFATVPRYRYQWATEGRSDPTLVPGRTGVHGGAVHPDDAERAAVDLVPLAGGPAEPDPARGLGPVLGRLPAGTLVLVVGGAAPTDLPERVRGRAVDPDAAPNVLAAAVDGTGPVLAVGTDEDLDRLAGALPAPAADRLRRRPLRTLDRLDGGPYGLIHDRMLGYLGAFGGCGRWHLDWPRVYARETDGGLAITLLRQRSPRLVDVLVGGGVRGRVEPCPRHGTPVVYT